MNTVIAETIIYVKRPGEEPFKVTAQVGTPYMYGKDSHEWACPVSLHPLFKSLRDIHGQDSFQALCLAISLSQQLLQDVRDKGGALSFEGSGDNFPLDSYFPWLKQGLKNN